MQTSRTQRSAWSVASGLLLTIISVSVGLCTTPWLLSWLGAERFGVHKVLMDWMSYLALGELGLSGALMACFAPKVAQGDTSTVRSLISVSLPAYMRVTFVMMVAGMGLVLALPYVISLNTLNIHELQIAGLVALLPVFLTPLLVFRALAEARQRQYLLSLLMAVQIMLSTGLCLGAAWVGWGLPGQSLATAIAQLPTVLILMWDGKRAYGGRRSASVSPAVKQTIRSLRWPTFLHIITDRVGLLSDNVMIAWILGSAAVAPFFLTQQLAALTQVALKGLSHATWAGLVELHAQGQSEKFRLRLFELTHIVSALGVAVLGPIAAYTHHFIDRWVGSTAYAGEAVAIIASVNAWFWAIYSLWGWPLSGTGYIGRWVPYAVVFMIVNLTVSAIGTLVLGWVGPLVGTLSGFLLVNAWALPRVLQQTFALSPWGLWRSALAPLKWGLLYGALVWLAARSHVPWGWPGLLLEMGLASLGGLGLWWTLSLDDESRAQWRYRFVSVLRSLKNSPIFDQNVQRWG